MTEAEGLASKLCPVCQDNAEQDAASAAVSICSLSRRPAAVHACTISIRANAILDNAGN